MKNWRKAVLDESGAVAVIAGIGLTMFLGGAAVALDMAHVVSVKSEVQKTAEAGALAGVRSLWPLNLPDYTNPSDRTPSCLRNTSAVTAARTVALSNRADGSAIGAGDINVNVGRWNYDATNPAMKFVPGCTAASNAVQVTVTRNNVNSFFAKVFGRSSETVRASATAVMDNTKEVGKGCLPIVLKKELLEPDRILRVSMNPDTADNGGWFVVPPDSANANAFRDYIENDSCPPLKVGQWLNLQNGIDNSALACLGNELLAHPDGNGGYAWDVFLPVVDTDKFNQTAPIDCFVPFRIQIVDHTGKDKYMEGKILDVACMSTALPGLPYDPTKIYGALSAPKLVN